jgi:dephospho-CoA kinase
MKGGILMSIGLRRSSMARVVAVCGMPGSGKGEFANVLHSHGIPVLSMGDMVRAEVRRLELKESPGIFGEIAAQLRAEHGEDVLAVRLADAVDEHLKNHSIVLIEGMRGTAERIVFEQRWNKKFSSLAVDASPDTRFTRIQNRGRSEDGDRESFELVVLVHSIFYFSVATGSARLAELEFDLWPVLVAKVNLHLSRTSELTSAITQPPAFHLECFLDEVF